MNISEGKNNYSLRGDELNYRYRAVAKEFLRIVFLSKLFSEYFVPLNGEMYEEEHLS